MTAQDRFAARIQAVLPPAADPERPRNLPAEQALLGALLVDNRILHEVSSLVGKDDFDESLHGSLFQLIADTIAGGQRATAITLRPAVTNWGPVGDLACWQYLGSLMGHAASSVEASDHARQIRYLAQRRAAIDALKAQINRLYAEDAHSDPAPIFEDIQSDLDALGASAGSNGQRIVDMGTAVDEAIAATMRAYEAGGSIVGLPTGIRALDEQMGGMGEGDLIYLAGRTGMGKSALAGSIAFHLLREKIPLGYISLEMPGKQLAWRYLAQMTGIPVGDQRRGRVTEAEARRLLEAQGALLPDVSRGFKIVDRGCTTAAKISNVARHMHRKNKIKLLIVDYLGLAAGDGLHSNKAVEVSEISRGLKQLAMQLEIPILCLLQVNRNVESREDKRLTINDLKDSGSLEQDADMVLLLHRDDYDIKRREPSDYDLAEHSKWEQEMAAAAGRAEVNVAKHRHDAPGRVNIAYDARLMRYRDLSEVR